VAKENTRIKHVIYKLTDDLKKTTKQTETIRNQYSGTLFLFNSESHVVIFDKNTINGWPNVKPPLTCLKDL
jgi:hypothetical protein